MEERYVISYDVGTSSVKAALIDTRLNIAAMSVHDYPIYHPQMGWAEQDPADYWDAIAVATADVLWDTGIDVNAVKAIVFSCQAMGIIPVDKDGQILYRNISWVDGRAEKEAAEINEMLGDARYGPKSVMPKLRWLRLNRPDIYDKTEVILDVNGYLKYRATGKYAFERSGACSYAFDLKNLCWNEPVAELAGVDMGKLPHIQMSTEILGTLTEEAAAQLGLHTGVMVAGGCNDVEASAIGSGSWDPGEGHIYLGSSGWLCAATSEPQKPGSGFTVGKSPTPGEYLLKGVMQSSGMTVDQAVGLLYKCGEDFEGNIFDVVEEEVAAVAPGSDGLIITPWIYGETCPVTSESLRSTVFNFTNIHTRAHILKAVREGIGYTLRWIKENMNELYGLQFEKLRIVGGGGLSDDWMQTLADILGVPMEVTENTRHAGTIGAAVCALIGCGEFRDFDEAKAVIDAARRFEPREETAAIYNKCYSRFRTLYEVLKDTYDDVNSLEER